MKKNVLALYSPVTNFPAEDARVLSSVVFHPPLNLWRRHSGFAAAYDARPNGACLLKNTQNPLWSDNTHKHTRAWIYNKRKRKVRSANNKSDARPKEDNEIFYCLQRKESCKVLPLSQTCFDAGVKFRRLPCPVYTWGQV
jgi:hypothetical protein